MNTDNLTDQEIVRLARECIIRDDFTTFSRLILSCRRRAGTSPSEVLWEIKWEIIRYGDESELDRFRQYRMSIEGAAEQLASNTGTTKHEVMNG